MDYLVTFLAHNHEPWGYFAILSVAFAFLVGALGVYLGRKIKSEKVYNIILFLSSLLLVFMEVTHEIGRYKEFGTYDWSSFPFQFCSVSMYLAVFVPFLRKGHVKNAFMMFMALFTTLSGLLPLIFAQGNLLRWPTLTGVIFSFGWHTILIFIGTISIGALGVGTSFRKDLKYVLGAFVIFFGITCIAQVLNVSIHYLAGAYPNPTEGIKEVGYMPNYELDPDSASLFYISPYFRSNIPVVFDDLWLNAGWIICWIVYVLAFVFGAILVYAVIYGIKSIYREIIRSKNYVKL